MAVDLYTKRNDTHQYLLAPCCHLKHCCKNIPYNLALRLRQICSDIKQEGKPSETDSIKFKISSKASREKKDSTKRQHHRHHKRQPGEQQFPIPASLTIDTYFYLFLYLYITRITIKNYAPHLKSPKNQTRRAALGRPAMKLLGAFNLLVVDQERRFGSYNALRHLKIPGASTRPLKQEDYLLDPDEETDECPAQTANELVSFMLGLS